MTSVFIGLGSNLDHPHEQVRRAVQEIDSIPQTQVIRRSPWYLSTAIGPPQPDYVNGVVEVSTALTSEKLLDSLQAIELAHQRIRHQHWGPRTLDLDILLWGDQIIDTERLRVPHPHIEHRNFVLVPLNDIAPSLVLPNGKPLKQALLETSSTDLQMLPD
jgi:2-amino-4-hydroxy-6-hydroxymethyldihydropteridine diphosphokinase